MTRVSRLLGIALAAAAVWGLAWASRAPLRTSASGDGVLRLAWSARPERIETCREQSAEALAALPAHMRQTRICEGTTATYRLEVRRNDTVIAEQILQGGGLRRDRRLYVLRELDVPPGEAEISVRVERIESPGPESTISDRGTVPATLLLSKRFTFEPRRVVLVTYDGDRRTLTAVQQESN